jgi:photosystem II stability/assembly factor-like uncharacterized protein
VLRTEDGGFEWQTCAIPPGAERLDFRGIQAFDANTAIVMSSGKGDLSRLYKTTDGCHSWKLVFTNPDKDGFWDAIEFSNHPQDRSSGPFIVPGALIGDPVNGVFPIFVMRNSGETWTRWDAEKSVHTPRAHPDEALFAASNEALICPGSNVPFAFVTGGSEARIYLAEEHSPFDVGFWMALSSNSLKFPKGQSAGAFAIAARRRPQSPFSDFMVVGGDYAKPDAPGASAFVVMGNTPFAETRKIQLAIQPPHGYRSAVAYDAATKTWITVGPNGTDISTDDGRNWRAVHPDPALHEPPDADRNWNALSLPFVVGPHGRIGKLNPKALKP